MQTYMLSFFLILFIMGCKTQNPYFTEESTHLSQSSSTEECKKEIQGYSLCVEHSLKEDCQAVRQSLNPSENKPLFKEMREFCNIKKLKSLCDMDKPEYQDLFFQAYHKGARAVFSHCGLPYSEPRQPFF